MTKSDYQSREFLISLLKEAKVVEDILEDVADASALAGLSVFSFASPDISVKTIADKLFLTAKEAAALKKVAASKLNGESQNLTKKQVLLNQQALPDFAKMVSVHVVASHSDVCHHRNRSMLSVESFLGHDREKKKVDTSSLGDGEESQYQLTDSTTDHESSIDNNYGSNPALHRRSVKHSDAPKPRKTSRAPQFDNPCGGHVLTDTNLAFHDQICVPMVPRLHLEDAGLSYGPANSRCPSYVSLDSMTRSELMQPSDLPVNLSKYKKAKSLDGDACMAGKGKRGKPKFSRQLKNNVRRFQMPVYPLPSYRNVSHSIHKTTAAFEASKRVLREQRQMRERQMAESAALQQPMKPKPMRVSKKATGRLMRPTTASQARTEETKAKITDRYAMSAKSASMTSLGSTLLMLSYDGNL